MMAAIHCGAINLVQQATAEHGRTRYKTITVATEEFKRRFLLHVLPSGFHRIRHYGLLANANRQRDIAIARELLDRPTPTRPAAPGDGHTEINRTSPAAFASTMPSRTPVASFCKTLGCCHHHRLLNARCRCVLGSPPTHIDHAVPTIFASLTSADVQIPIDPRLC